MHNKFFPTCRFWYKFIKALELQFSMSRFENHQSQFEHLSNHTRGIPPLVLLNFFLSGLLVVIQRELHMLKPYSIYDVIGLAKMIEAKLSESRSVNHRPTRSLSTSLLVTIRSTPTMATIPIKCPSTKAMYKRCLCGLCFNCDERWMNGHHRKSWQFMILLVEESEGDVDAKGDISPNPVVHDKEPPVVSSKHFHISRATLLGLHHDALSESHGTPKNWKWRSSYIQVARITFYNLE